MTVRRRGGKRGHQRSAGGKPSVTRQVAQLSRALQIWNLRSTSRSFFSFIPSTNYATCTINSSIVEADARKQRKHEQRKGANNKENQSAPHCQEITLGQTADVGPRHCSGSAARPVQNTSSALKAALQRQPLRPAFPHPRRHPFVTGILPTPS